MAVCTNRSLDQHNLFLYQFKFSERGLATILDHPTPSLSEPRFSSVTHTFAEVGHTHGPVDQRLSIIVSAFSNADVIQTPQEGGRYHLFRIISGWLVTSNFNLTI